MIMKQSLTSIEGAATLCRLRGGRLTPQRRAVLAAFLAARQPLTAYKLRDLILPEDPAITPASVYRSLEFLIEMGLVHRLESTRSFVACEYPEHTHDGQFLICHKCGSVVEAEDKRVTRAVQDLSHRHGYVVAHRTVELVGLCGACQDTDTCEPARP
jgi:Fur family transcriptional regulator, zinc uptake regulator